MIQPKRARRAAATALVLALSAPLRAEDAATEGEPSAERHQVADGDTLSQVAERYLGTGDAWPKLWSFNPEITNPHWIYPGHVLRLREGVDLGGGGTGVTLTAAGVPGLVARSGLRGRATPRSAGASFVLIGEEVYLDRDALADSARIVGSSEDHLMLSPTDEVYLQYAKRDAVPRPGTELTVFVRQHRAEVAPSAGKVRSYAASEGGEIVRVMGALRITSYDGEKRIARAMVTEALDPIERGFEVADVPRRLAAVPPKSNEKTLQAKILAATRALSTLGEGQVVFLDAGAKQGVAVGNRFVAVRQGDPWRQQLTLREDLTGAERPETKPLADSAYPSEIVAELRVLYVRPESSTALITSTQIELAPGERVEMRTGY